MAKKEIKFALSSEMQDQWQPEYDEADEFKVLKYKRNLTLDNYTISRSGVICGPNKKNLKWGACSPNRNEKSSPRCIAMKDGTRHNLYVHICVAFSFFDEVKWNIPVEVLQAFEECPDVIKDILISQCFQVDHIDENTWNPSLDNLQIMLPYDNQLRSKHQYSGLGHKNTGENHWTAKRKMRNLHEKVTKLIDKQRED